MKKIAFSILLVALLALSFLTLIRVTPLSLAISTPIKLINFFQRVLGLLAFTLLFVQIILGAFMDKLWKRLGGWIFNYHIIVGIVIYILVFLHPVFLMFFNHLIGSGYDPYAVFINACLLCKSSYYYYYSIGIVSFWLLTIAVITAIFRKANEWLKLNWRKFHLLNYIIFLGVGAHGFFIGRDFRIQPFYSFALIAYLTVLGIVIFIEVPKLYKNFKNWVNN